MHSVPQAHLLSHRGESQTSWSAFLAQASCQGTGPHSWVPSSPSTIPSLPPHKFWEKLGISFFCSQLLTQTLLGFNFHNWKDSQCFFSNREALLRSHHLWPHTHTGWQKLQNAQGREEGLWYHLPDPVVGTWLKPWISEGTGGAKRTSDGWGVGHFLKYLALQFLKSSCKNFAFSHIKILQLTVTLWLFFLRRTLLLISELLSHKEISNAFTMGLSKGYHFLRPSRLDHPDHRFTELWVNGFLLISSK